ncbi:MAG: hypothetical protein ACE5F6_17625 [Anaerolineae bacterium]
MSSDLERELLYQIKALQLPEPEQEYRFHERRRWRFDFAWPEHKIAVEAEGGTWSRGRHTRGKGFEADCEKYNTATYLEWRVFRFTAAMIRDGTAVDFLERVFRTETEQGAQQ